MIIGEIAGLAATALLAVAAAALRMLALAAASLGMLTAVAVLATLLARF